MIVLSMVPMLLGDKPSVKENSFDGAPGGTAGSLNYQAPLNTHTSPENSQDPSKFTDLNTNKAIGSAGNTDNGEPMLNMPKAVDQIYSKKTVPTADQVKAGLDYELHNMIKPDKRKAKEIVLTNLRRDPKYYGELRMMNIDDEHMQVDLKEAKLKAANAIETKKIFMDLSKDKDQKYVVNSGIVEVMKQMWTQKQKRRDWLSGGGKTPPASSV